MTNKIYVLMEESHVHINGREKKSTIFRGCFENVSSAIRYVQAAIQNYKEVENVVVPMDFTTSVESLYNPECIGAYIIYNSRYEYELIFYDLIEEEVQNE